MQIILVPYQKVVVFLSKIDVFGEKASRRKPQAGSSLGGWMQPAVKVNYHVIRRHAFPPSADTRVFVCGLPEVRVCIGGD